MGPKNVNNNQFFIGIGNEFIPISGIEVLDFDLIYEEEYLQYFITKKRIELMNASKKRKLKLRKHIKNLEKQLKRIQKHKE